MKNSMWLSANLIPWSQKIDWSLVQELPPVYFPRNSTTMAPAPANDVDNDTETDTFGNNNFKRAFVRKRLCTWFVEKILQLSKQISNLAASVYKLDQVLFYYFDDCFYL